jgi:hypothetical protein
MDAIGNTDVALKAPLQHLQFVPHCDAAKTERRNNVDSWIFGWVPKDFGTQLLYFNWASLRRSVEAFYH